MKFVFTGRKMEVTEDVKAYAMKKLSKLDRFFQNDAEANIVCHIERGRYTAEVTVHCVNMYFRAQDTSSDLYAAFDNLMDIIERQIRKNKTRLEKRLRVGAFEREVNGTAPVDAYPEEREFDVIRRKRFAMKPMAVEEAILQMNLLEHEFYAFKNADDENRYSVVYKRNDGGYGLIEAD